MVRRESWAVNCVGFKLQAKVEMEVLTISEAEEHISEHCAWMGGLKHHNVHQVFTSTGMIRKLWLIAGLAAHQSAFMYMIQTMSKQQKKHSIKSFCLNPICNTRI